MINFDSGIGRVTGYSLGGRRDAEAGVREVLKPLESWGVNNHTYDASFGSDNLDFLLEGVPTLDATMEEANYLPNYHAASDTLDKVDIRELKLHTVIAALTAWGIADRPEPLGKRLSPRRTRCPRQRNRPRSAAQVAGLLGRMAKRRPRPQTLTPAPAASRTFT